MHVSFTVSGYYDWEVAELHPGVQITEADVKQLRAKRLADGRWAIKVEKAADTRHDTSIPELQICQYLAGRASIGEEPTRLDAILQLLKQSARHHVAKRHVEAVALHDDGPVPELLKLALAERGVTDDVAVAAAVERYTEPSDVFGAISAQHVSLAKKGA